VLVHWWLIRHVDPTMILDRPRATPVRMRKLLVFSVHILMTTVGDYLRSYTHSVVIAKVLAVTPRPH
jgi:hypothetical protein